MLLGSMRTGETGSAEHDARTAPAWSDAKWKAEPHGNAARRTAFPRGLRVAFCFTVAVSAGVGLAAASETLPSPDDEPITAIPHPTDVDGPAERLGAALFRDQRLSGNSTRSCASCHDIRTNGASGRRFDAAISGQPLPHNTPTVFNSGLNWRQNWSGSVLTLEDQADLSVRDPAMMNGHPAAILDQLRRDPGFRRTFRAVYGRAPDWTGVLDAIARYERSLLTPDSRFDLWLAGHGTLTTEERAGYREFKSIGCTACHQGANIGGNLLEQAGILQPMHRPRAKLFKVPSLRNVAATAPYFDDGSAPTLEIAVRRMGSAQLGRDLSPEDVAAISAFLRTLTGRLDGRPVVAAVPAP